jgi:MFS family permease
MPFSKPLFIFQSIMMMVLLGSVYLWGVFRVEVELVFQVNASLSGLPYMVSLVSYALSMLVAGKFMKTHRPWIIWTGVASFVLGFWFASMSTNFYQLMLSYGVLIGTGVGLLYGVPIYIVQQSFEKHVGWYSGLILMGFGLSNTILTPIVTNLLSNQTIQETMMVFGWVALGVFSLTIWPLFQPLPQTIVTSSLIVKTYDKPAFRSLYIVYILSLISGLTIVGITYRVGMISYQFDNQFITIAISIFAFFNGVSRPFFGGLVDRFGFFKVAFFSLVSLVASGFISLFNNGEYPFLFAISYGAFWFGLGNWMALMPLSIKTIFDKSLFSTLYGKLFTAYGVAAVIGTLFSGAILDLTATTWPIYTLIVCANIVNLILVLWLKQRYQLKLFK